MCVCVCVRGKICFGISTLLTFSISWFFDFILIRQDPRQLNENTHLYFNILVRCKLIEFRDWGGLTNTNARGIGDEITAGIDLGYALAELALCLYGPPIAKGTGVRITHGSDTLCPHRLSQAQRKARR